MLYDAANIQIVLCKLDKRKLGPGAVHSILEHLKSVTSKPINIFQRNKYRNHFFIMHHTMCKLLKIVGNEHRTT